MSNTNLAKPTHIVTLHKNFSNRTSGSNLRSVDRMISKPTHKHNHNNLTAQLRSENIQETSTKFEAQTDNVKKRNFEFQTLQSLFPTQLPTQTSHNVFTTPFSTRFANPT